jgi:hypothetical protein
VTEIRGPRTCGPVQIVRAETGLAAAGKDAGQIVKAFKTVKDATAYASGEKGIDVPDAVKSPGEKFSDPFARGRGLVAICLALHAAK